MDKKRKYPEERAPRHRARKDELAIINKALALVGGSFAAAAKLLDITPQRFRNLVHGNAVLRAKWGRKRRGRGVNVGFYIRPFDSRFEDYDIPAIKEHFVRCPPEPRQHLAAWLVGPEREKAWQDQIMDFRARANWDPERILRLFRTEAPPSDAQPVHQKETDVD